MGYLVLDCLVGPKYISGLERCARVGPGKKIKKWSATLIFDRCPTTWTMWCWLCNIGERRLLNIKPRTYSRTNQDQINQNMKSFLQTEKSKPRPPKCTDRDVIQNTLLSILYPVPGVYILNLLHSLRWPWWESPVYKACFNILFDVI